MIDRNDVAREISRQVKAGFDRRADILEGILETYLDPDDLEAGDETWIKAEIARRFAEKRNSEAAWPARTDWDRLDDAFRRIGARGVLALHDAGVTQSDAISDAGQEYFDRGSEKSGLDGYVFYHRQDVDQAVETGDLYLGFGRFRDDVDLLHAPSVAIAELVAANFAVEWPADPDKRIHVSKIVWLKRSPKD